MKRFNQHIQQSAPNALFVLNILSAGRTRPEVTGALAIAYGSNLVAISKI